MNQTKQPTPTPTPGPWSIDPLHPCDVFIIRKDTKPHMKLNLCQVWGRDGEEAKANAAHIVRCVNAHEELVAMVEAIATSTHQGSHEDDANELYRLAAIVKALLAKVKS